MTTFKAILIGSVALAIIAPSGIAHFRLLEPASWIQENQLGDPQKLGPCGGTSADPGKPTGRGHECERRREASYQKYRKLYFIPVSIGSLLQ